MKTRAMLIAVAAFAVLAPSAQAADGDCRLIRGAATPADPTDDVQVCRQDVWLHKGDNQIANLGNTLPSWDTTKPAGATTSAGVYYPFRLADILEPYNPDYRPTFRGRFTGTIDTLGVQAFVRLPVYESTGTPWPLGVRLLIDQEPVFTAEFPNDIDVPIDGEGNFRRIRFAFTNVYEAMKSSGLDVSSTKEHEVELSFIQNYWGDGLPAGVFFDGAEVPSGLSFNLELNQMAGYTKIDAGSPPA